MHDYFLYDWHKPHGRWHGFKHPAIALKNATRDFKLTEIEKNLIVRHMFPLVPIPPKNIEGGIVCMVDKWCSLKETFCSDIYKKDELVEQLRTEVMSVFQNVANELGTAKYKVPVLEMPSQTDEIREMMDEKVFDAKIRERGIEIVCFAVESVTLTDDSAKKIDDYELSSNSYMQQGRMVGAYSNAVENAAKNENGAANGFMGIGMMNMSTNGMMQNAANGPWNQNNDASRMDLSKQEEAKADDTTAEGWTCECGHVNPADGKFCSECGKAKTSKKVCPKCKMPNDAGNKFCNNCGEQL